MGLGDKIRKMLNSFLDREPADAKSLRIKEQYDFRANAFKNLIWYNGVPSELHQFYSQVENPTLCFWGSTSTKGMEIRKIHTGIPGTIVDTLTSIVVSDMNEPTFENAVQADVFNAVYEENNLDDIIESAITDVQVLGDGAFKLSIDSNVSKYPIVEWVPGDKIDFKLKRGRLEEIVFYTRPSAKHKKYILKEKYGFGYVKYELFKDGQPASLSDLDETRSLVDIAFDKSFCLAVPFMLKRSKKYPGRGASLLDNKIDNFDALDEAYSQWWQSMRACRPKTYIPTSLLERNSNDGGLLKPNAFDNSFIKIADDMSENGYNKVDVEQLNFASDQYLSAYITALDLCLQGLISPSTLGIDVKKLDNAEAQREKEKATLYSRAKIIDAFIPAYKKLITVIIFAHATVTQLPLEDVSVDVQFGEYANPSFEAVIETMSNPNTPMSIEAKVDEMWGDSKDEQWKKEEVVRIKEQSGISSLDEPAVGAEYEDKQIGF